METLLQDIKFGFRTLSKNKGFTIVAVITLALAIGANTAIFSIVNPLLLRGLPVADPNELVILGDPGEVHGRSNGTPRTTVFSYPLYKELTAIPEVFSNSFAAGDIRRAQISTSSSDPGQSGRGRLVTASYFSVLGVSPAIGRLFAESEADVNKPTPVAVISYAYWKRQFGGDASVVGRTIRVNNVPVTIIGVSQPGFEGEIASESQDIWAPMNMQAQMVSGKSWLEDPRLSWLQIMGRLKPGVSREQAEARVNLKFQQALTGDFGARVQKEDRDAILKDHIKVESGARGFSWARDTFTRPMVLLMIIVGLVLVMACTNISNMLLARSSSRSREIALRVAIGARPWRVVRQLITESVLLAFMGGLAGLFVAQWGTHLLLRWVTQRFNSLSLDVTPDARVLGFAALLCILTGVLFGLVPALRALKVELTTILGQSARGSAAQGHGRFFSLGNLLVAAQFAVSMLVITGAGLLVRSLYNLQDVDLGYPREQLIVMKTDPLVVGWPQERLKQLVKNAPEALRTIPGVKVASVSENGLFSGTESGSTIKVEGFTSNNESDMNVAFDQVGPGYFKAIGAQFLLGRDFDERDDEGSTANVIINETMTKFYFKDKNPIGRKITYADDNQVQRTFEIIGVVKDVRDHSVREAVDRRFYFPLLNSVAGIVMLNFEIRTSSDPNLIVNAVRQKMNELAQGLPIVSVETIDELAQREVFKESMLARLSGMFGVLALVLAAVGLYGLMSYMVVVRTKEIGIRLALGAQRSDILKGIVKQALVLATTGVAVGLPIAYLSGHAMKSTLYEVGAGDPVALGIATAILAAVALISSLIPAINAVRVDPMVVLRYE
jgi:putative ABC transport system permease protein